MSIVVEEEQFTEDNLEENEALETFSKEEELTSGEVLDDLEDDIAQDTIPEKFQGKELSDVVKSYTELEKELGRKQNEVGELRRLTDDFLKQQLETPTKKEVKNQVDLDDLLENPNDVISKVAADANDSRISALEEQLKEAKIAEKKASFEGKHNDWQDVVNSSDFQGWVHASEVRQRMFTHANTEYDYDLATELFDLYKEVRGAAKEKAETKAATKRKKALKDTSVEKGSTGEVMKKIYRRADLVRLKQTQPHRYNEPSFQEEIMLAYQEGRVR